MSCCYSKRKIQKVEKKYNKRSNNKRSNSNKRINNKRSNKVSPDTNYDYKNSKVDSEFIEHMRKDVLLCGGCNTAFTLRSEEIKIHCNGCEKFFHCKIAGECQGKDCCIQRPDGSLHRARYCYDCAKIKYDNNQCLCKDCYK